jgi:hypothetical protein
MLNNWQEVEDATTLAVAKRRAFGERRRGNHCKDRNEQDYEFHGLPFSKSTGTSRAGPRTLPYLMGLYCGMYRAAAGLGPTSEMGHEPRSSPVRRLPGVHLTTDIPAVIALYGSGPSAEALELRVTRLKYCGSGTIRLPDRFLASMQF